MSAPQTMLEFRDLIERSGLLSADVILPHLSPENDNSRIPLQQSPFAQRLLDERLLTPYQVAEISKGNADGFFLNEKYKLLEFIGEGGMGKVFLCEHLILQRLVAVKVLQLFASEGSQTDPSAVERFYREARAIAALDHRNIVRVFDVDRVGPKPFMVMEYLDGSNLHQIVTRHAALSIERAANYIKQAATGLDHAHQSGLIHRDIKPSNLILDRQGIVKLLDLGLARFSRDPSKNHSITDRFDSNVVMGTVDFMAPEQAVDSSRVDIRADIYSLGCTWYFLLTCRPPFPSGTIPQKMYAHQNQAPEPISMICRKLPQELNAIIDRMMEKDPNNRFQTPAEIDQALSACVPETLPKPPEDEMPRIAASYYRLGLSTGTALSSASSVTPNPTPREETLRLPRDNAGGRQASRNPNAVSGTRVENDDPSIFLNPAANKRRIPIALFVSLAGLLLAVAVVVIGQVTNGRLKSDSQFTAKNPHPDDTVPAAGKNPDPKIPGQFVGVIVSAGGSTFIDRMMQLWAEVYEKRQNVRINYAAVGSGKGTQGVIDRVYQFGCSDAPMSEEEMAKAEKSGGKILHIPLVMGAVVCTYNLPDVARQLKFNAPVLADIYLGKIVRWNDPAIKITNPGVPLPDMPISVVHRASKSGTTFIWTDFLSKASGEWNNKFGSGRTDLVWPIGDEALGNDGVATRVSRKLGAIGYVELSYALENNLRFALVKNRAGKFIEPKLETVTAAGAASLRNIPADLRYSLTDAPGEDSYPIAGTTWAIIYADQTANPRSRELVEFLRWATHDGQAYLKELRFAPLPPDLVKLIDDKLATIQLSAKSSMGSP